MKIRTYLDDLKRTRIEKDAPYRRVMSDIAGELAGRMDAQGKKQLRTDVGTAFFEDKVSVTVEDMEAFGNYVREHDGWELADLRANKPAVDEFLEETGALPPGVKRAVMREVRVRKV